jgi:hypothetical protein
MLLDYLLRPHGLDPAAQALILALAGGTLYDLAPISSPPNPSFQRTRFGVLGSLRSAAHSARR